MKNWRISFYSYLFLHKFSEHLSNSTEGSFFKGYKEFASKALEDMEAGINHAEAAVKATPEGHPDRAKLLSYLADHLNSRYERTGNLADIQAALSYDETAVGATPEDHPQRARLLFHFASHLSSRYERIGNFEDLEASINHAEEAVKETPEDHPHRAETLDRLGISLYSRYVLAREPQDLKLAITAWLDAWSILTAPVLRRIAAAAKAVSAMVSDPSANPSHNSRAYSLIYEATHLISLATSRSLQREDQQHILGQLHGLASLAVAVSLQAGKSPWQALRLQELARGVTNGQLFDYRSDISGLMEQYPTLATEFGTLREELDSPFPSVESPPDSSINKQLQRQQAAIRRRNKIAIDLNEKLEQIRQKPGFQTFLRAGSKEYFLSAAQEGPIVVLNATSLRSDAILLTKEQVTSIPLPELSDNSVTKHLRSSSSDNGAQRETLDWLWKAAVQPVLRELGFYPKAVDPLPRIWWIGIGLLAQAPIHAATKFTRGTVKASMSTFQYCTTSYTSTIRALQYSRSRGRKYQRKESVLIVTMPTKPGESSLSGVCGETEDIKYWLRDFSTVEILEQPTVACALRALSGYSIAHFACHGESSSNPADSHLLLLSDAGEVDRLRVKDIAALKLREASARLAYLSACSTANSPWWLLSDEVTNIVSSFHVAGYINVIGTLWPAQDEACRKMAADFYSMLSKTDNVVLSYRAAIMGLMKQKPSQPMYWAPFIHFGA